MALAPHPRSDQTPRFFANPPTAETVRDYTGVPGLDYLEEFLNADEQRQTLAEIDDQPWLSDLKRRVQHYGYKYDYKARSIDRSLYVGPLPGFARELGRRLVGLGLMESPPDQLIVNEYLPGQGISAHVDCEPCFGNHIVTVSLGSVYEMEFTRLREGRTVTMDLGLGSALSFHDEARRLWTHCIRARKSDDGRPRGRRVSLTFRNVILTD